MFATGYIHYVYLSLTGEVVECGVRHVWVSLARRPRQLPWTPRSLPAVGQGGGYFKRCLQGPGLALDNNYSGQTQDSVGTTATASNGVPWYE